MLEKFSRVTQQKSCFFQNKQQTSKHLYTTKTLPHQLVKIETVSQIFLCSSYNMVHKVNILMPQCHLIKIQMLLCANCVMINATVVNMRLGNSHLVKLLKTIMSIGRKIFLSCLENGLLTLIHLNFILYNWQRQLIILLTII